MELGAKVGGVVLDRGEGLTGGEGGRGVGR